MTSFGSCFDPTNDSGLPGDLSPRVKLAGPRRTADPATGTTYDLREGLAKGTVVFVSRSAYLQAALNGDREHPAAPRTPDAIAKETRAAVAAGARSLHLHPYETHGRETLEAEACAATLQAMRAACPAVPVSLSTSSAIEPDSERRLALIAG